VQRVWVWFATRTLPVLGLLLPGSLRLRFRYRRLRALRIRFGPLRLLHYYSSRYTHGPHLVWFWFAAARLDSVPVGSNTTPPVWFPTTATVLPCVPFLGLIVSGLHGLQFSCSSDAHLYGYHQLLQFSLRILFDCTRPHLPDHRFNAPALPHTFPRSRTYTCPAHRFSCITGFARYSSAFTLPRLLPDTTTPLRCCVTGSTAVRQFYFARCYGCLLPYYHTPLATRSSRTLHCCCRAVALAAGAFTRTALRLTLCAIPTWRAAVQFRSHTRLLTVAVGYGLPARLDSRLTFYTVGLVALRMVRLYRGCYWLVLRLLVVYYDRYTHLRLRYFTPCGLRFTVLFCYAFARLAGSPFTPALDVYLPVPLSGCVVLRHTCGYRYPGSCRCLCRFVAATRYLQLLPTHSCPRGRRIVLDFAHCCLYRCLVFCALLFPGWLRVLQRRPYVTRLPHI